MVNDQVSHSNIPTTTIDPKSVLVENSANTMNGTTSQHSKDSHGYSQVPNSPPMAVLPLNPSAKLDQEPNPFEQSFSSASKTSPITQKTKLQSTNTINSATAASAAASAASAAATTASTSTSSTTTATTATTITSTEPLKLPPVAAMTSPAASGVMSSVPKDVANQYAWDSLRTGPLSPSMLQRPTNPDDYAYSNINPSSSLLSSYQDVTSNSYQQGKNDSFYQQGRSQAASNNKYQQDKQQPVQKSTKKSTSKKQTIKSNNSTPSPSSTISTSVSQRRKLDLDEDDNNDGDDYSNDNKIIKKPRTDEEDEKRKNFLERNRLAALKCRQRKKQWLNNLQAKVEYLTNDNEQLQIQTNALREEIMNLKTLLLAHKDCPISQVNGFPSNINPKAIGVRQQQQQQQQALLRGTGVTASSSSSSPSSSSVAATAASTASTATPMFTSQPYNHAPSHHHPHHLHHLPTTAAQSSSSLNMVMVSQHPTPQPSTVSSSSGVMQF